MDSDTQKLLYFISIYQVLLKYAKKNFLIASQNNF